MFVINENIFANAFPSELSNNAVPNLSSAQPHNKNTLNSWDPSNSIPDMALYKRNLQKPWVWLYFWFSMLWLSIGFSLPPDPDQNSSYGT